VTLDGLLTYLRLEVDRAGGVNALGRKWGICSGHISRVLRKQKVPGPLVLARLGMRERIEYEPDVRRRRFLRKERERIDGQVLRMWRRS
jgi:hypothetical protein